MTDELNPPITEVQHNWVANANLLWDYRHLLARTIGFTFILSVVIAFALPKRYESTARLMPPESGGNAAMLAAVLGRSGGGLGNLSGLAGSVLGTRTTGALFLDLLRSRTIADRLIDRFGLQGRYHTHYRIDTVKALTKHAVVDDDKKSGVISITVTDTDPARARNLAQAYVEELNKLVVSSNTSSAHRERLFIEQRLTTVQTELETAQKALSEFSSNNTTLDIKEQTHAMVDSAARLQAEKIVADSELESIEQVYGPDNVRVRAAHTRVAKLQEELNKMGGSSAPEPLASGSSTTDSNVYPSIRQLPRLAVPYANLYRRVRIEETVFELLSQQFEMSRIEEAKDTPAVSLIDAPLIAEKHSFPARHLIVLGFTAFSFLSCCVFILLRESWRRINPTDARKKLVQRITATFHMPIREAR